MSDLMNAIIAAKLMGNGGGGGGGGLPPIIDVETELFNGTIEFSEGPEVGMPYTGQESADFVYEVGKTYTISWDNTTYTCVCLVAESGDDEMAVVGNLSIVGMGEDTGEPFLSFTVRGKVNFMTLSTAATHNCVVSGLAKSIPDGTVLIVIDGEWKMQSGYAYERNGNVTPFNPDFISTK